MPYTGTSIVDYFSYLGKPNDLASRAKAAAEFGIVNSADQYQGTAEQNLRLLAAMRDYEEMSNRKNPPASGGSTGGSIPPVSGGQSSGGGNSSSGGGNSSSGGSSSSSGGNSSSSGGSGSSYSQPSSGGGSNRSSPPAKTWDNYWITASAEEAVKYLFTGDTGKNGVRIVDNKIIGPSGSSYWEKDASGKWQKKSIKASEIVKNSDPNAMLTYFTVKMPNVTATVAGNKINVVDKTTGVKKTLTFTGGQWATSASEEMKKVEQKEDVVVTTPDTTTVQDTTQNNTNTVGTLLFNGSNIDQTNAFINRKGYNAEIITDDTTGEKSISVEKDGKTSTLKFDGKVWADATQTDATASDTIVSNKLVKDMTTKELTVYIDKKFSEQGKTKDDLNSAGRKELEALFVTAAENDKKDAEDKKKNAGPGKEVADMLNELSEDNISDILIDAINDQVDIVTKEVEVLTQPMREAKQKQEELYNQMETEGKSAIADQWADIDAQEKRVEESVKELENIARKSYEDYTKGLARSLSGIKAKTAGDLAARGFNSQVIANIANQVEEKWADRKLAAQDKFQKDLQNVLATQTNLEQQMANRKNTLTTAEQNFYAGLVTQRNVITKISSDIATKEVEVLNPIKTLRENIVKTLSGLEVGTAENPGGIKKEWYKGEWKTGTVDDKTASLRTQVWSFMGQEKNADGTYVYDVNSIPSEKYREWALLESPELAYEAAVAYLQQMKKNKGTTTTTTAPASTADTKVSFGGGNFGGGGASGSWSDKKTSSPSGTSTSATQTSATTGTESLNSDIQTEVSNGDFSKEKEKLLKAASLMQERGVFARSKTTYDDFVKKLNGAKDKNELQSIMDTMKAALNATPEAKSAVRNQEIYAKVINDAQKPFTDLSETEKQVVKTSPQIKDIATALNKLRTLDPYKYHNVIDFDFNLGPTLQKATLHSEYSQAYDDLKSLINTALSGRAAAATSVVQPSQAPQPTLTEDEKIVKRKEDTLSRFNSLTEEQLAKLKGSKQWGTIMQYVNEVKAAKGDVAGGQINSKTKERNLADYKNMLSKLIRDGLSDGNVLKSIFNLN